ncbi:CHAT domain-containing protein [Actinospica sp. MGRD01-02]|uniref:CHAT domain-containing protein n=1 Tax=Actinospica acidithermotolerans TaxID=2828514 RepID=A0A941IIJ4_9ACTN|nr:CHAT domain-containing protein [Actinospica acidithermotolerans]MBR7829710.1 CHAT domain-containing protein [Actinospica acidithermotolerans]
MSESVVEGRSALLRVDPEQVALICASGAFTQGNDGLTQVTREALRELTEREGAGLDDGAQWKHVGRGLGDSFLDGPAGFALARELTLARESGAPLRLGIDVRDPALADLPWEALVLPARCDRTREHDALALEPAVLVYRISGGGSDEQFDATDWEPDPPSSPRALHIVFAIAAPREHRLKPIDYQRELRDILKAVRPALGTGAVTIRILNWGTLEAIHAALKQQPADILHISCHAGPGVLALETVSGSPDIVDAQTFVSRAFPDGQAVPMVVLAGCSSARTSGRDAGRRGVTDANRPLRGLAQSLIDNGVQAVVAMTTDVYDTYSIDFAAELYEQIAADPLVDPLTAVSQARRTGSDVHGQWYAPALFLDHAAELSHRLLPRRGSAPESETWSAPEHVGGFAGRRTELRELIRILETPRPWTVVHGMGGIGKSALVEQSLAEQEGRLPVTVRDQCSPDQILAAVAQAADAPSDLDARLTDETVAWRPRLDLLRESLLPQRPMVLAVDGVDGVLDPATGEYQCADAELTAFLEAWMSLGPDAALIATSRYPIEFAHDATTAPHYRALGPLTATETERLLLHRLENTDRVTRDAVFAEAWWLGGHPGMVLRGVEAVLAKPDRPVAELLESALEAEFERAGIVAQVQDAVADEPLCKLLVGAGAYRSPVLFEGLEIQYAWPAEPEPDAERTRRLEHAYDALRTAAEQELAAVPGWDGISPYELPDQVHADVAEALRPARDPSFPGAILRALQSGLLYGPFAAEDEAAFYHVHPVVAALVRRRVQSDDISSAHKGAATYWRWRADTNQEASVITSCLDEAIWHLAEVGDISTLKQVIPEALAMAALNGGSPAPSTLSRCEFLLNRIDPDTKETVNLRHLSTALHLMAGDSEHAMADGQTAYESAQRLGDARLLAESALLRVRAMLPLHLLARDSPELIDAVAAVGVVGDQILSAELLLIQGELTDDPAASPSKGENARAALHLIAGLSSDRDLQIAWWGRLTLLARALGQLDEEQSATLRVQTELQYSENITWIEVIGHSNLCDEAIARSDIEEADAQAQAALTAADNSIFIDYVAYTRMLVGTVAALRGDRAEAEEALHTALSYAEFTGNAFVKARIHSTLGDAALQDGLAAIAAEHYRLGAEAAQKSKHTLLEGICRIQRAFAGLVSEDLQMARSYVEWEQTQTTAVPLPHAAQMIKYLLDGGLAQRDGDFATAKSRMVDALDEARADGSPALIALSTTRLLALCVETEDYDDETEDLVDEMMTAARASGNKLILAQSLLLIGAGIIDGDPRSEEDLAEAEEVSREAFDLAQEIDAPVQLSLATELLHTVATRRPDMSATSVLARELVGTSRRVGDDDGLMQGLTSRFFVALGQERFDEAEAHLTWWRESTKGTSQEPSGKVLEGMLAFARGDDAQAEQLLRAAFEAGRDDDADEAHRRAAGFAAYCLGGIAEDAEHWDAAEYWYVESLLRDTQDLYSRYMTMVEIAGISRRRAQASPERPWWTALEEVARRTADANLAAAAYQAMASQSRDGDQANVETWLEYALNLWPDENRENTRVGPRRTRHDLALRVGRRGELDKMMSLLVVNLSKAPRSGAEEADAIMDAFALQALRDYHGDTEFTAKLSTLADPATCARILEYIVQQTGTTSDP